MSSERNRINNVGGILPNVDVVIPVQEDKEPSYYEENCRKSLAWELMRCCRSFVKQKWNCILLNLTLILTVVILLFNSNLTQAMVFKYFGNHTSVSRSGSENDAEVQ